MMTVYVSEATRRRLEKISEEMGTSVEMLAEAAIENNAADLFRHRKDDPARGDRP